MQISQQLNVVVVVALLNNLLPAFISILPIKMVLGASVDYCYSDIGCFPLSAEFYHPRYRPFNVRPWHRSRIRTQFELFNRDHPEGFIMVPWDRDNLINSKFNPKLETKIIVPGWLDNINRALWVRKLKDALLWLWVPVNVIVVRWTNFTPYTVATANTRVVGAEMANMMKFIDREFLYDPAYYHIIGHSLGAHIAGYCGDRVHGLGRITALDPARPFFQHMPKSVRLDRGDAKFVDAIHSDFTPENAIFLIMSYGMTTPVGHLDFYPNGPPLFQPGCIRDTLLSVQTGIAKGLEHNSLSIAFLESVRYLTACDHQRSHEWFIESITNRECAFVGVRCNEFEGMINGRCTCDDSPSACAIMGIHADQMYLHNVHEELWPVRAGSIKYKFNKRPLRARPPSPLPQAHSHLVPGVDLDQLSESMADNYNLMLQNAHLSQHQQSQSFSTNPQGSPQAEPMPDNKDEIYARLKYQAMQMHQIGEPAIAPPPPLDYHDQGDYVDDHLASATTESTNSIQDEPMSVDMSLDAAVSEPMPATDHAGDLDQTPEASNVEQVFDEHMGALDDMAFAGYLRSQLLLSKLDTLALNGSESHRPAINESFASNNVGVDNDQDDLSSTSNTVVDRLTRRSSQKQTPYYQTNGGHPDEYAGHPKLISDFSRDIESWYEDNGRWHLKTNNRPKYCSNQYQLLIFLGPLKSSRGHERLRADLLVSIVGSRGQLLKQRFVPRSSTLTSFTMQPFFILLEGSYSLGQIKSVALSWEARSDPDPIQATVTFESNRVQQIGENVPAYEAKQFPWLPEETKYDKTAGFNWRVPAPLPPMPPASLTRPHHTQHSRQHVTVPPVHIPASNQYGLRDRHKLRFRRPGAMIKSKISGHYSQKYRMLDQKGAPSERGHHHERSAGSGEGDVAAVASSLARNDANHSIAIVDANVNTITNANDDENGSSGIRHLMAASSADQNQECSIVKRTGCLGRVIDRGAEFLRRADSEDDDLANSIEEDDPQQPLSKEPSPSDTANSLEQQQLLNELFPLGEANEFHTQETLANRLAILQEQHQPLSPLLAKSQKPNQTYLVSMQHEPSSNEQQQQPIQREDTGASDSEPYFVSLIDPIDTTASRTPPRGSRIPPDDLVSHEGEITLDLHNVNLKQHSSSDDDDDDDSIVVNQVIVSPLQANYGRRGRNAKTFCPQLTRRKLTRDKTLRLTLSMMSKCSEHHQYEHQIHQLRSQHQYQRRFMPTPVGVLLS